MAIEFEVETRVILVSVQNWSTHF